MAFTSTTKRNLPIYGIKNKHLSEFTTTEKDRDKGISRIPLPLARIYEEDIIEEQDMVMTTPHEELDMLETYAFDMEHRKEAFSLSKRSDFGGEEFGSGNERDRSSTLFSRTSIESVNFEDFRIIKIIGRGTFGKVRLRISKSKLGILGRKHKDWEKICDEKY